MDALRENYNNQFRGNEEVHKLISKVDEINSRDVNLALLLSTAVRKDALKGVVNYLKETFAETYPTAVAPLDVKLKNITKADLVNQILDFVAMTVPSLCPKCDTSYMPHTQADSATDDIACFLCRLPAHRECYKTADISPHLVYLCHICIKTDKKEFTKDSGMKDKEEEEVRSSSDDGSSSDDSDSDEEKDANNWQEVKKKKKGRRGKKKSTEGEPKKEEICPLLIEGKCPHGIKGTKCDYTHKKPCNRYQRFGTNYMHRAGCKFGENCRYLHPTLCQNSVIMRKCLNEGCTNAHLLNTERKIENKRGEQSRYRKPMTQRNSSYQQSRHQSYRNQESTNYGQSESYNVNYRTNNTPTLEHQNETFLSNMMERLQKQLASQIQKEIKLQFGQLQQSQMYNTEYPSSLPQPGEQSWNAGGW